MARTGAEAESTCLHLVGSWLDLHAIIVQRLCTSNEILWIPAKLGLQPCFEAFSLRVAHGILLNATALEYVVSLWAGGVLLRRQVQDFN